MANLKPRISGLEKRVGLHSVDALMRRYGTQAMIACLDYCLTLLREGPENPPVPPPDFQRIMDCWSRLVPEIRETLELIRDGDQAPR